MRKGLIAGNEKAVLLATQIAFQEKGRPVSAGEVIEVANRLEIPAPRTPLTNKGIGPEFYVENPADITALEEVGHHIHAGGFTEGGWNAFDWPDRTVRYLKRLEKKGKVKLSREGRHWYALPLEESPSGVLDVLTERAMTGGYGGSGFHEYERKLGTGD